MLAFFTEVNIMTKKIVKREIISLSQTYSLKAVLAELNEIVSKHSFENLEYAFEDVYGCRCLVVYLNREETDAEYEERLAAKARKLERQASSEKTQLKKLLEKYPDVAFASTTMLKDK